MNTDAGHAECHNQLRFERAQIIDNITRRNPSATYEYLDLFSDAALELYFEHLLHAEEPRGSIWSRPGDTSAIVYRRSAG